MTRDITRDLLDDLCAGVDTIATGPVATELRARLEVLAESGDQDAANALDALLHDGCAKRVQRYSKTERIAPAITHDGRPVSLSMRGGIPKRDPDSGDRVVWFQQTLFSAMSWAQFDDYIANLIRQIRTLSDRARLLTRFSQLREQYPDSHGPGEAAALAGTTLEALLQEAS